MAAGKILVLALLLMVAAPCALPQEPDAAPGGDAPKPPRNRLVRVVTVTLDKIPPEPEEKLMDALFERLERAETFGAMDIVCLPEHCVGRKPEAVPGPATEKLGAWARAHRCWVICPLIQLEGGKKYNAAALLDRQGRVSGVYHKSHFTEGETEELEPGPEEPPVFKTDFGAIGIQICFDVNWHAGWKKLKEKGAEIVFFPAAYPAARQLKALAWLNRYFIVSSTLDRASTIYDLSGEPLAASGRFQPWAGAVLPLGKRLFETDANTGPLRAIQKRYGNKVEVTLFHDDDWVTLASLDPDLTVEDLIKEYKLTPIEEYHPRCARAQAQKCGQPAAAPFAAP